MDMLRIRGTRLPAESIAVLGSAGHLKIPSDLQYGQIAPCLSVASASQFACALSLLTSIMPLTHTYGELSGTPAAVAYPNGSHSRLSSAYILQAYINCRELLMHWTPCAFCLARASAGSSIAAKMAIMAITTNSSMRVNPFG